MARRKNTESGTRQPASKMNRRSFLAVSGAVTTTFIAGCAGGEGSEPMGTFRLYISDQPVAIDEFDSLDVTVDGARIFRADDSTDETETTTAEENTTTAESEQAGFIEIDIDNETVDLTTLTGEKATGVFDGEVPVDRYSSVHLSVSQVDGVIDGETVPVELPSERLKIVKPFEVTEGELLTFVFDITVVKKGQAGGYSLLPVVGESGVVGTDVEMQAVEQG